MSLTGKKSVTAGEFTMSMVSTPASGGFIGEKGTIDFRPFATAKKTNNLRLLQIVQLRDKASGADFDWSTTAEARRNTARTTAAPGASGSPGVEGGFFVDHFAAGSTPRTKASDATVSPYYRDHAPNSAQSHDGWLKSATDIKSASLWDFPQYVPGYTFKFETAAKAADTGAIYGTVKWQFTTAGTTSAPTITGNTWDVANGESATFDAAVDRFNDVYHNPGSPSAPAATPPTATPPTATPPTATPPTPSPSGTTPP
jgi:hypothetical protein